MQQILSKHNLQTLFGPEAHEAGEFFPLELIEFAKFWNFLLHSKLEATIDKIVIWYLFLCYAIGVSNK